MKRLFLAMWVLIMLAGNANAGADGPTDSGVYSLTGMISYTRASGGRATMVSIAPAFMYFVYPNLALGSSIDYWDYKTDTSESESYGIGPVVRYYFGDNTIYPFASFEYMYTDDKLESNYPGLLSSTTKGHGEDFILGLGVDYFLARNAALEAMVNYRFSHNKSNSASSSGSTSSYSSRGEDLFIGIGVNVFIF